MAKRLRAVDYDRVSTEEEKQLNALENQIQENRDTIKEMGWIHVGSYIDEGKSGTTTKRRGDYKRLLEDMENDVFDIIVVKDQDRLQRNTRDWYLFVDRLLTNNLQLYFYLDNKFFTPNDDALITGIKAILAEEYSRNLSKKLNNANRRRVEKAKAGGEVSAMGNGKSLGYKIENKKWVKVPQEIEICLLVWDLYEEYDSIRKVRDRINSLGYTNSVGKPFTSESIVRILKNEKAKGVIVMGKHHHDFNLKKIVKRPEEEWVRVEAPELAYVSAERFDNVQARLQAKTGKGRGKNVGRDPLSGKLYCGNCGEVLWKHQSNGYTNWYCKNKMAKGEIACTGTKTTTVKINKIFAEIVEDLVVNRVEVKNSIVKWLDDLKKSLSDDTALKKASQELEKAQNQRDKLLELYLEGLVNKEAYKGKLEALELKIKEMEEILAPMEDNEDIKEVERVLANIDQEIDAYIESTEFENSKLDFLIEHTKKITVLNSNHLIIELDLITGALIGGKDFLLYVHESVYYRVQTENYIVDLKLVA